MMQLDGLDWDDHTIGITGAGGFIGLRALQRFAKTGASLRGLDVSKSAARRAEAEGAEVVVGDTRDPDAAAEFCEGCDVVLHTAAIVGEGGDFEKYRSVNVEGTRTVLDAAEEHGIERFIHLSSVMVYGFDFPPEVEEDGPLDGEGNAYCETKLESEEVARNRHGKQLDVLVIRPGDVYGPGSQPWVVRPLELMKSRLFALPDGGHGKIDPTYVDNLIDAIAHLLENDEMGEVFNVTDGLTLTTREFFSYHAAMLGGRWIPTAPAWLLERVFGASATAFRTLGRTPPAAPDAVHFLNKPHGYSTRKLRETGFRPTIDLSEGMDRVETWARSMGLLDSS